MDSLAMVTKYVNAENGFIRQGLDKIVVEVLLVAQSVEPLEEEFPNSREREK